MPWESVDSDRIYQIMRQTSGEDMDESTDPIPQWRIKGEGETYFWVPSTKSFTKVSRGTFVYIISFEMDDKRRVLVFDTKKMFAVPFRELEKIGFN
jgi:hypothetical protein